MPDLDDWLELYASETPAVRLRAARALLRRSHETPLAVLLDMADRLPDQSLGAAVERALGGRRDPELLDEMIARLAAPDALVRGLACAVLGRMGNADAVPHVARMLDDPELIIRQTAIQALVALGGPASVAVLETRLADGTDDDPIMKNAIETALMMLRIWRDKDD